MADLTELLTELRRQVDAAIDTGGATWYLDPSSSSQPHDVIVGDFGITIVRNRERYEH